MKLKYAIIKAIVMKRVKYFSIGIFFFALVISGCEKIGSVEDIVGVWTSDLSSIKVELIDGEAYVTRISVTIKYTTGAYTNKDSYSNSAVTGCKINNYKFSHSGGGASINGEFVSEDKLILNINMSGRSDEYECSKL